MDDHVVLAHHLVLSSYGFWLSNDPRGSGSVELRERKLEDLGPIHQGRRRLQPTRQELREFYARATPRLEHAPLWFNGEIRQLIAEQWNNVISRCRYTVWACSIGSNHAHLCIRRHRDTYQTMWQNLTGQVRIVLQQGGIVGVAHPVWAQRPYSVFCHSPEDIRRVVEYIEKNPEKEGLAAQQWPFVRLYDGWPFANQRPATR